MNHKTIALAALATLSAIGAITAVAIKDTPKSSQQPLVLKAAPSYCAQIFDELSDLRCQIRKAFHGESFDAKMASRRLADFRLEGTYQVCSATTEVLPERYVELAIRLQELSSADGITVELMERIGSISNQFVDQPNGMSDCDWRVMEQIFGMYPPAA